MKTLDRYYYFQHGNLNTSGLQLRYENLMDRHKKNMIETLRESQKRAQSGEIDRKNYNSKKMDRS